MKNLELYNQFAEICVNYDGADHSLIYDILDKIYEVHDQDLAEVCWYILGWHNEIKCSNAYNS